MHILGIDTCCMAATSAVIADDRLVAQVVQNNNKTHSQSIMPMIDFMLTQTELSINGIDGFAVAVGPGSFTGVRIGVATIKALAHPLNKPCIPVSTLEALAYNVAHFEGIICPILDARRNQVYAATFFNNKRLTEDRAVSVEELIDELKLTDKNVIFVGDGIGAYGDTIKAALGDRAIFASRSLRMNLASSVAEIGYQKMLKGETVSYTDLKPTYLRMSQAERERLERMGGKNNEK